MYRSVHSLILLLALAACRETGSEADRAGVPDAATRTGGAEFEDGEPGVEFEAPRLIPAIRAQITEIEDPEGATEGNLAAFKNGVGTLVSAMKTDLNRVGVTDTADFYALSDSVLRKIGGTASDLPDQVERLIGIYEERMRKAAN
jgi:hypothetical protein